MSSPGPASSFPPERPPRTHLERFGLIYAVGVYLATRGFVLAVALSAPLDRTRPNLPDWWSHCPLMRWDSGHYRSHLLFGYPEQIQDGIAFLPGFSLAAWPFTLVMDFDWAFVVAAQFYGLLVVSLFYLWVRRLMDARAALIAVVLYCAYPPAFFFSTGYADSFFLLAVMVALWALTLGRHGVAAAASAVATFTRPTGVCLAAVVVLYAGLAGRGRGWTRRVARSAVIGTVSLSGLAAYQLYLWQKYDRFDAYFAAQETWTPQPERHALLKTLTFWSLIEPSFRPVKYAARGQFDKLADPWTWNYSFNLALVSVAVYGLSRPGPLPRWTFLLPILVCVMAWLPDPAGGGRLLGIARYQLIALPCFAALSAWRGWRRRPALLAIVVAGALALQVSYIQRYCNWMLVS